MAKEFDPKELAEYESLLAQVGAHLQSILAANTQRVRTAAEIQQIVSDQREVIERNLQITFQQAEASGKLLDTEQRRNLLFQQHRDNLQKHLASLTTEYYENQKQLTSVEQNIASINSELTDLGRDAASNTARITALTNQLVGQESRRTELKREILEIDDAERKGIIAKITAEMQYTEAKMKSSQAAQSAMTMLFGLDIQAAQEGLRVKYMEPLRTKR
jgi:chromosome segregation ATPase